VGVLRLLGMSIERIRVWYWSLGKFDAIVALLITSISSLLLFRLPLITHYKGIYFNEIFQYVLTIVLAAALIAIVRPPTLRFFGRPRFNWVSIFALAIAGMFIALNISDGYNIHQPLRFKVAGIIFLLTIGLSEELLDRILIFGTLQRFGMRYAVIVSSLIFGLTHLNVYLPNWHGWQAFTHVCSATGFGLLACGILLATRSYWVVVIFHALADWTVVFDGATNEPDHKYTPGILEGLRWGAESFFLEYGLFGLILLFAVRGKWPRWVIWLAIKWKLVEQAEEVEQNKSRKSLFSFLAARAKVR
jgi:membrane protease YdiL (CAAX protease family)